jgi:hypothetical protein
MSELSSEAINSLRKRMILFSFLCIPAWLGLHHIVPDLALETALLLGVCYILMGYQPLIDTFRGLNRFYQLFSVALLTLLLVGHLIRDNMIKEDLTFPFVTWNMYGTAQSDTELVFYELVGERQSGVLIPFNPVRALPSSGNRIIAELSEQARAIESTAKNPERHARQIAQYEATVKALVNLYNQSNSLDPIVAVSVFKHIAPLATDQENASEKQQFLWKIDMEE